MKSPLAPLDRVDGHVVHTLNGKFWITCHTGKSRIDKRLRKLLYRTCKLNGINPRRWKSYWYWG